MSISPKTQATGKGLDMPHSCSVLAFFLKEKTAFPWLGEKSDFPVPLGPGMKQFSALMLTLGQSLRLSPWARLLGLLSSDLSNASMTNGQKQQEACVALAEGELLGD